MIKELVKSYPISYKDARVRCIGHIINLIVKVILFSNGLSKLEKELYGASDDKAFAIWNKQGVIRKIYNISVYVNRTDQRRQEFFKSQADASLEDNDVDEDDEDFYY